MQRESRMKKEIQMLEISPPPGISCCMKYDKLDELEASVIGPSGTPYENGVFKLSIHIPERYPFVPPNVNFVTPIYHPNIDTAGRICLDILKMPPNGGWKPCLNVSTVLTSIQLLMSEPNPEDPLLADVAEEFKYNKGMFVKRATVFTQTHAIINLNIITSQKNNNEKQTETL